MSAAPAIRAAGLTRDYPYGGDAVHALRGVDVEVARGEFVAVVGPSGCGKSSLLNILAGIDPPTRGSVELLGHDLYRMGEGARSALRLRRIGFVFQRFHLLGVLSAAENVELPMAEAGVPRDERRAHARELLDFVGLAHRAGHRPPHLSGGEQQRVAVARALANRPDVVFADEPTGELDQRTGVEIIRLFERLHAAGTTLMVVTHDARVADHAPRTLAMADGRVVSDRTRG
jgi:predicted ABC-type transport system involved in lysophospholipase L1 biosynthesis ATPase subunit